MNSKILVIGGTGLLGVPVVNELIKNAFDVCVLARDTEKAKEKVNPKAKIVNGDVLNQDELENALKDCNGVHISIKGEIEYEGVKNVVAAAKKAKVQKISYVSGTTVFEENKWYEMIERKLKAEEEIKNSGIPYSIFCPTWFYESLGLMVKGEKAFMFGNLKKPFHFVSAKDFAQMVVRSYQTLESNNQRFFVHGPEPFLFIDALEKYVEAKHPEIKKISNMSIGMAKIFGKLFGKKQMIETAKMFDYFAKVGEMGDPNLANNVLGKPKMTLKEFLGLK